MSQKRIQFNGIYERNKSVVAEFLRLQVNHETDRDELFQEIWLEFYVGLDRSIPDRPRPYLLQIARRKIARYRQTRKSIELPSADLIIAPENQLGLRATLEHAIGGLDESKRDVFLMKHRLGLDYNEIATVLEIPIGTVSSRLHHAISDLKSSLKRAGFDSRIGESA